MSWEVEQKYRVTDLESVQSMLSANGARWGKAIEQADTYFSHPARDFGASDEALRLRQAGDRNFITYKGPRIDTTTKTRQEVELPLPDGPDVPPQFRQLLELLGFRGAGTVAKRRLPGVLAWQGHTVHLALDEVAGLGSFVELELVVEETAVETAKVCLRTLADHLKLAGAERRSYLELLRANKL